jgi:glycerophosphoryl diester phosphodiesterase
MNVHGHRGCRGLLPENTLEAFHKALELGVNTLEMDVCISQDLQVVVSHEPWFNHEIATQPDGSPITPANERSFNLYQMSYAAIRTFDCGLKKHPRFPYQKKIAAHKPLLTEVIKYAEQYSTQGIQYNIEIKYTKADDQRYHPNIETFSNLLLNLLEEKNIHQRTMVQCFDPDVLNYIHATRPQQTLSYLVEEKGKAAEHLEKLSFIPQVYSPDYTLLTAEEIDYCHQHQMLVIPWTINEKEEMKRLISLGVDGIITDYPDRLIECLS